MRKALCVALLICLAALPACAGSISGQRYETFLAYYEENLAFINDHANRHLLPLVIAKRTSGEKDGRLYYEIFGDVLSVTIRTDPSGEVVEACQIVMTAPQGMEYGDALYNDFTTSGYHSYALLMAMQSDPDPARRYELVSAVENGLAEGDGQFTTQLGVYTLHCARVENSVTLSFDNAQVDPAKTPEPEAEPGQEGSPATDPDAVDTDQGAGLG